MSYGIVKSKATSLSCLWLWVSTAYSVSVEDLQPSRYCTPSKGENSMIGKYERRASCIPEWSLWAGGAGREWSFRLDSGRKGPASGTSGWNFGKPALFSCSFLTS